MENDNKILVIEDEMNIRESLAELLEFKGFEVIMAKDGQEGIVRAIQHKPDLIICDVMMPKIDGHQVLHMVRKNKSLANIPFIFLTAKTNNLDIREGMNLGADDYLTKPFRSKDLYDAVNARLDRKEKVNVEVKKKMGTFSDQFSDVAFHEINTPLTGVITTGRFLLNYFEDLPPDEIRSMLNMIVNSGERLHRMFYNNLLGNQILMARLNGNQEVVERMKLGTTSRPKSAIEEKVEELSRHHDRTADIKIALSFMEKEINVSDENLKRIVGEIIDNALKFSEKGTPIKVTSGERDGRYYVKVIDKGRGMHPYNIKKIDAFQQFDRKHYEQQGTGLGLFLAKSILEFNGGALDIQSQLDEGTTVWMWFAYV